MANTPLVRKLANTDGPGESFSLGKVATIKDVKANSVDSGTFTSGAWQTRDLNTLDDPLGIGITLSSNQFTLPAGTYLIEGSAPAFDVGGHKTRIQNISDASTLSVGTLEYADPSSDVHNRSEFLALVTIPSSKVFEVQHHCGTTVASNGFGAGDGSDGDATFDEIYTQVKITKLG